VCNIGYVCGICTFNFVFHSEQEVGSFFVSELSFLVLYDYSTVYINHKKIMCHRLLGPNIFRIRC
jgi:hypothetical protein